MVLTPVYITFWVKVKEKNYTFNKNHFTRTQKEKWAISPNQFFSNCWKIIPTHNKSGTDMFTLDIILFHAEFLCFARHWTLCSVVRVPQFMNMSSSDSWTWQALIFQCPFPHLFCFCIFSTSIFIYFLTYEVIFFVSLLFKNYSNNSSMIAGRLQAQVVCVASVGLCITGKITIVGNNARWQKRVLCGPWTISAVRNFVLLICCLFFQ